MTYYIRAQIVPLQIVKTTTNSGIGLSGTSKTPHIRFFINNVLVPNNPKGD